MKRIDVSDVPHSEHPRGVASTRRRLGDELGTDAVDVTYYEIDVGGRFSGAYHRHLEREEVYVVLSGTASFRTEHGSVTVREGQAIRFEPGDWQLGINEGEEVVTAILVGSPERLAPVEAYLDCPACDDQTLFTVSPEADEDGGTLTETRVCSQCGTSFEEHQ